MKKLLTLFIGVTLLTGMAKGQTAEPYENNVKLNPLGLLFSALNMSYERAIDDTWSVQVNPGYIFGFDLGDGDFDGFNIGSEARAYFSRTKSSPQGIYVGPFVSYSNLSFDDGTDEDGISIFAAGAEIGHQWIWDSGVLLDLNAGGGYGSFSETDTEPGDDYESEFGSFVPKFTFALGYNF